MHKQQCDCRGRHSFNDCSLGNIERASSIELCLKLVGESGKCVIIESKWDLSVFVALLISNRRRLPIQINRIARLDFQRFRNFRPHRAERLWPDMPERGKIVIWIR
uniref:Uncharacterized protein n=1 Tax=Rhizobium leguminosarum bv. trifolii TaxID=386 RepID=A0A1C9HV59_RHILT|nr:hypothetical protein [Rhizobium leguminosarum bv. trifolii]